jgi:hypothetical protein
MSLRHRGRAVATALTALTVSAAVAFAGAPTASADDSLHVLYDAVGSSVVAKTHSSVNLGPATLSATVAPDGSFTASLPLPPATTSFKALGLLPISATVTFVAAGPVTGQIVSDPTTRLTSTSSYYIKLSNVKTAGLPTPVGPNCQTAAPVSIPASGPFSITHGGTLTGTYTIGRFSSCGLTTALINLLIPGPGNTVTLTMSNGRLGG